ncbi:MAG: inorganic phosphate transporter [Thauera propionica]|uniref:Phosphate transporter n=1 Tax=Thauera propionica TaxID=2019431 RepID=A0A235F0G4_9RHOO|nr:MULTISPECIES: inorganic phosphate transporter [Thauera]MDD3674861.1 inorganic phosphate transporter [Thauera propionica]MDI3490301.1 inorganic phosphate transporter, PiT family [Thauera sp.]MDY0046873.1 inorganic phosphate transporter [Thauera propionica]OYD54165.1 inorganic phosphate transporter [Thauera propionica]
MDLQHISEIERATHHGRGEMLRLGVGLLFIVGVMFYAAMRGSGEGGMILVMAAMVGGYMAMNIGANDVANNVGPAVGSKALSLAGALVIAAVFEAAGALIAGGEVVGTIRNGIINPDLIPDSDTFVWIMLAALLAGALWLNIATAVGAPVSTTHSIVGAVLGAGMAAAGPAIVDWATMAGIAASWVVSPVLGGVIAAAFLYLVKRSITYQADMAAAARKMVPLLVALMAWTFGTYLILKGLNRVWKVGFGSAVLYGLVAAVVVYLLVRRAVSARGTLLANTKQSVNRLFTVPLIFAAALLSFAHGSNDVANAVGPLAAIVDVVTHAGVVNKSAPIPTWVMMVGALGISLGLALFGPKVIRTVGSEITELDQMRAYCIAMAATLTVIVASQFGLPVSSTHIAVGGVFGVGFLREYLKSNYDRMVAEIKAHHPEGDLAAIEAFIARFEKASIDEKGEMLRDLKERSKKAEDPAHFSKTERKGLRKVYRRELVKRSQLMRIAAAWVITVPASALMAAMLFFTIRGMMLP